MTDFVVACDIDEVLFPYLPCWVQYYNRTHNSDISVSDFHSYNFSHVLTDHDEEYITTLVYEFHEAPEFLEILPIADSVEAVKQLQEMSDVHFVTSRQNAIAKETYRWIYQHFGIEQEKIHIGNHWCKDTDAVTAKKSKVEMCRLINAQVLIDDSLSYAEECAAAGMHALLFDLGGTYGWNKVQTNCVNSSGVEGACPLPANITRVTSWQDTIDIIRNIKHNSK